MKRASQSPSVEVTKTDGFFKQGKATNVAIAQPGEARGHEAWADATFVKQLRDLMNTAKAGTPSRWSHDDGPEGTSRSAGRFFRVRIDRDGVLRGTLHFNDSTWGRIVRERMSEEDTGRLGASAYITNSVNEEAAFKQQHSLVGRFRSPERDNRNNYRHLRALAVHAVDIVKRASLNRDLNSRHVPPMIQFR